jgi:hypothetical protein
MRWAFACVAVVLAALFLPIVGQYVAIVIIGLSLVPIGFVQLRLGPTIDGFARAHALNGSYLTLGIVALPILCFGVGCLIKALWGRNNSEFAVLGIVSLGYLAVTVLAYFRLGMNF